MRKESLIIQEFLENGKAKRNEEYSKSSLKSYLADLEQLNYWLGEEKSVGLEDLNSDYFNEYMDSLKDKKLKVSTLQKKFSTISSFVTFLGKSDILREVRYPLQVEEAKTRMDKRLDKKEIKRILNNLEKRGLKNDGTWRLESLCHRALIHMLFFTDIKTSNILSIKMDDFINNEDKPYIMMNDDNKKEFKCYISKSIYKLIIQYLDMRNEKGQENKYLFQSRYGGQINMRALLDVIKRVGKDCKIKELNIRIIRNSYRYSIAKENGIGEDISLLNQKLSLINLIQKKKEVLS